MFTGLVEDVGAIVACEPDRRGGARLRIGTSLAPELAPGDSLAINGVCLTVVRADAGCVDADVGPETLRVTTLGALAAGVGVNLERPLRADGRFGGHLVQGHVDAVGRVEEMKADGECYWLGVSFPPALASYLVPKGSIAVDGISLTIAELGVDRFRVQVVPFTAAHTNLKNVQTGDHVNLECDLVGKYVVRAAESAWLTADAGRPANVTD